MIILEIKWAKETFLILFRNSMVDIYYYHQWRTKGRIGMVSQNSKLNAQKTFYMEKGVWFKKDRKFMKFLCERGGIKMWRAGKKSKLSASQSTKNWTRWNFANGGASSAIYREIFMGSHKWRRFFGQIKIPCKIRRY